MKFSEWLIKEGGSKMVPYKDGYSYSIYKSGNKYGYNLYKNNNHLDIYVGDGFERTKEEAIKVAKSLLDDEIKYS